jgi:hypothetical protein
VLQLVVRMVVVLQRCERCFRSAIQTERWTPWRWVGIGGSVKGLRISFPGIHFD